MDGQNRKIILAVTALTTIAIILSASTYAALSTNQNLSTTGEVNVSANLGLYSNSEFTTPINTIIWGKT